MQNSSEEIKINQLVFEKWKTDFDIEKLKQHLLNYVLPLEPMCQSSAFGGWSVLSSTGSYKDGWQMAHEHIKENMTVDEYRQSFVKAKLKSISDYVLPTEICHGYLHELIEFFKEKNLSPARARIIRLTEGTCCSWHHDAPENIYAVRLHVPIITNDKCFFEIEGHRAHLPADGSSYFLFVNRLHRVVNWGKEPRYHLVIDVKDRGGISTFHKYS